MPPGLWLVACLVASAALPCFSREAQAGRSAYEWALIRLDYALKEKVGQLRRLSERLHELAHRASTDEAVVSFFAINSQYSEAIRKGPVPAILTEKVSELRTRFNRHYIENYFAFYDILFVDLQGNVFYHDSPRV